MVSSVPLAKKSSVEFVREFEPANDMKEEESDSMAGCNVEVIFEEVGLFVGCCGFSAKKGRGRALLLYE